YVENASSVPTYGSEPGKNFFGRTVVAATPYRKKSYHSIVVPTAEAVTTRRRWRRRCSPVRASGVAAASGDFPAATAMAHSLQEEPDGGKPWAIYHTMAMMAVAS